MMAPGLLDRLTAVACHADHLEAGPQRELHLEQCEHVGLIVRDDDPQVAEVDVATGGLGGHAAGNSRWVTSPPPRRPSTQSRPPSWSASTRATVRPRPRPGEVVTARSPRQNGSSASRTSSSGNTAPG